VKRLVSLFLSLGISLYGGGVSPKLAGSVVMIGFDGTTAPKGSPICRDIERFDLAGVILFDRMPGSKSKVKNIRNPQQLSRLTRELRACSGDGRLLIAIDQEGGAVQRLGRVKGFGRYPKASTVARRGEEYARKIYGRMADELSRVGIDYNLAPVVDLSLNPRNRVIYGFGRSYGGDVEKVVSFARIFIEEMHSKNILVSLKHFPGHGSSTGDTHEGFVDVSGEWKQMEMEPFGRLASIADSVMVAHIYNRNLDRRFPASLSKKTIGGYLTGRLGFDGVVISDDMQMGALEGRYPLKERLRLALEAGEDILLFANQTTAKKRVDAETIVKLITALVEDGKLDISTLERASRKVKKMKRKLDSYRD